MPNMQLPHRLITAVGEVPRLTVALITGAIMLVLLIGAIFSDMHKTTLGTDPSTVLEALQARGSEPVSRGPSRAELLYPAPGQAYQLNPEQSDQELLFIHVYQSQEAARNRSAQIQGDQRVHMIDWIAPPHFFRCGNLIVLYLGDVENIARELGAVCGVQFAESKFAHRGAP